MSSPDDEPGPSSKDITVKVALRIRPQIPREKVDGARICTNVAKGEPQVMLGNDRAFTYDHVFDICTLQTQVYASCVKPLVEGTFSGYNATVLAYGQTGSGKTYSMGTGLAVNVKSDEVGIIPRAVQHLFDGIDSRIENAIQGGQSQPIFKVQVQFIELYNEDIVDLLDVKGLGDESKKNVRIHEDSNGGIYMTGVSTVTVASALETMDVLRNGALNRSTASTNMNSESSRSHALFSIHIRQQKVTKINNGGGSSPDSGRYSGDDSTPDLQMLQAKFHFVDLAGSERLKRTGATGDRAKEGISINCGLLALGNVISALGDVSKKASHVPYRDSKLTRLLQDSLGGNSRTLMIACISPSDCDFVETLNTLKYANRAKNIKNKVVVNQDKTSRLITELRTTICALQAELIEYKQGKRMVSKDGDEEINDQYHENVLLQNEVHQLRVRVKAMTETCESLKKRNVNLLADSQNSAFNYNMIKNGSNVEDEDEETFGDEDPVSAAVRKYLEEIEDLRASKFESDSACEQLRRQLNRQRAFNDVTSPMHNQLDVMSMSTPHLQPMIDSTMNGEIFESTNNLVEEALSDIERLKQKAKLNNPKRMEPEETTSEDQNNEDSSSDEEIEEAEEKEAIKCREDLADLQTEISIKEKLVDELQRSQMKLEVIKQQYENKLRELMNRIMETESERDRVLVEMKERDPEKMSSEKVEQVKQEYENKLGNLRCKLKQVQTCEREHQRMLSKQRADRDRLTKLTHDLDDMKKAKVQLMQKMREETKRAHLAESQRVKQVAQLHKEARKQQTMIKDLQNKDSQKEAMLRRKQEELLALKKKEAAKQQLALKPRNQVSTTALNIFRNMRTPVRSRSDTKLPFSPKIARQKWNYLEQNIGRVVTRKQTLAQMENELERLLVKRENVQIQMRQLKMRRARAPANEKAECTEQIEALQANLEYVNESIADSQKAIVMVDEESKDGEEVHDEDKLTAVVGKCTNLTEAKYVLEHLLTYSVSQGVLAAQKEAELKEQQARLQQLEAEHGLNSQLLEHVINGHPQLFGLDAPPTLDSPALLQSMTASLTLTSPISTPDINRKAMYLSSSSPEPPKSMTSSTGTLAGSDKARRRTATTQELLYPLLGESSMTSSQNGTLETVPEGQRTRDCSPNRELQEQGIEIPEPPPVPPKKTQSKPLLGTAALNAAGDSDGVFRRPNTLSTLSTSQIPNMRSSLRGPSTMSRQNHSYAHLPPNSETENNSGSLFVRGVPFRSTVAATGHGWTKTDISRMSMCESPRTRRKQQNVFQRLRPFTNADNSPANEKGQITDYKQSRANTPIQCIRVAAGHSKSVLTVVASDNLMLTGSKDRTAKLWDLNRGEEIFSSSTHPNSVNCVKMLPNQRLIFTASWGQVKIWDTRTHKCIKTLSSSGLTLEGESVCSTPGRQTVFPPNECMINAIAVDSQLRNTYLLTAAGNQVRLWDLRNYAAVGKLASATSQPKSDVTALATASTSNGQIAITGSRDHIVKTYKIPTENLGGVIDADCRLDPPHYDGISALTPVCAPGSNEHDWLISGSRDQNLMKWDLKTGTRLHQEVKAHPSWILGLCTLPSPHQQILVSSCRDGQLRLWNTTNFQRIAAVQAHAEAINCIASNSTLLFSACSDGNVGMWKPKHERLNIEPETEC